MSDVVILIVAAPCVTVSCLLGPIYPSFQAFYGCLESTVRRHEVKTDFHSWSQVGMERDAAGALVWVDRA